MWGQPLGEPSQWERVEMRSRRGVRLVGCWHRAGGERAIILCHGMESCKEGDKSVALAEQLVAAGSDVLRFDFSYVGESEGVFEDITVSGEVEDLAGAWAYMRDQVAGPIGIVGSSLGGTVALLFASQQPEVAAVATIAAVAVPGRRARALPPEERRRWRVDGSYDLHGIRVGVAFLEDIESLDVVRSIPRIRCPLMVTHGTDDEVVPVEDSALIAESYKGDAEVRHFAGADHRFSDPATRADMLDQIARWMLDHVGSTTAQQRIARSNGCRA